MGLARDWEKRVIWTNITYAKRTVRIFSVSPQSRSLSSASFQTFGLTALASHALRACEARARKTLTPRFTEFFSDFEKKKTTVWQSKRHSKTLRPLSWSETLCSNSVDSTLHSTLCSAIVKIIFVSQEPQCLLVYTCFKKSLVEKKRGQMSVVVKYT